MTPRRTLALAGVAVTCVTGAAALGAGDTDGVQHVAVTVDAAHPGRAVPPSFLGLSLEVPSVPYYAGGAGRPNLALRRLLTTLGAAQGSAVALRIGGNSTDESWWAPGASSLGARPRSVRYVIGDPWLRRLAWLARAVQSPVTIGANLADHDPTRALAFALAVRDALPHGALRTVEIGNEPDIYTRSIAFHAGHLVVRRIARRARYGHSRYEADVRRYVALLSRGLGRSPALAAGGFAGVAWDATLPPLLREERGRLDALSAHAYPLNGCPGHAPRAQQLRRLLSDTAGRGLAAHVARMVAIGRRAGAAVHVTEMNSATCGGIPGISDSFASALWAPGALFAMARAGVGGVDLHSWPRAPYAPFAFTTPRVGGPRAHARPLYYGLLLFADAAGQGSRLLPTHVTTASGVRAWATLTRSGGVRVVAVNPSPAKAARVTVALRGAGAPPAVLRLMRAPGLQARHGVSLGGRVVGADGRLHGRDVAAPVVPIAGRYSFSLPAASAGLLSAGSPVVGRRE